MPSVMKKPLKTIGALVVAAGLTFGVGEVLAPPGATAQSCDREKCTIGPDGDGCTSTLALTFCGGISICETKQC